MSNYPCEVGAKFIDKYSGEIATVIGFRVQGRGWQVRYTTPNLNERYNHRQSWSAFKRNNKPRGEEVGRG